MTVGTFYSQNYLLYHAVHFAKLKEILGFFASSII